LQQQISMPVCPREFGGKSDNLSHLGTSVIYLIAADSTPEPAWQAVIDAGANGKIAVAQAKAIIAAHKPPQPPATQPPADTELVRKHDYKFLHHPLPPYVVSTAPGPLPRLLPESPSGLTGSPASAAASNAAFAGDESSGASSRYQTTARVSAT